MQDPIASHDCLSADDREFSWQALPIVDRDWFPTTQIIRGMPGCRRSAGQSTDLDHEYSLGFRK